MTMTNAEWMIKNGYKFSDLDIEDRGNEFKIYLKGNVIGQYPQGFTRYEAATKWLDMEHKEPILDDAEKRYLKGVIRPFRKNVTSIRKIKSCNSTRYRISISVSGYCSFDLPWFDGETMYKGMEVNRHYTLEELGL